LRDRDAPVPGKKRQHAITADDVPCVFNETCIARLADIAKLPEDGDRQRWGDGIREAARIYALAMRKPDATAVRHEIEKLHRAAEDREYDRVAALLEALSPQALRKLTEREVTPGFMAAELKSSSVMEHPDDKIARKPRHVLRPVEEHVEYEPAGLKLPSAQELREPATRDVACEIVKLFCTAGVELVEGRMRPTGRRSASTWQTVLYAPVPMSDRRVEETIGYQLDKLNEEAADEEIVRKKRSQKRQVERRFIVATGEPPAKRPPKREAERRFVVHLQLAWLEASDKPPPLTANPQRLGPFARMVRECLKLAGAGYDEADKHPKSADFAVADLINEVNKRRRTMLSVPADEEGQLMR
jgi:hypothetical protein